MMQTDGNSAKSNHKNFDESHLETIEEHGAQKFCFDDENSISSSISFALKSDQETNICSSWLTKHNEYDLRLTLFACALYSLKTTTVLKPYPLEFFNQNAGEIQRDKLIEVFESLPIQCNNNTDNSIFTDSKNLNRSALKLVSWVLTQSQIELKSITMQKMNAKALSMLGQNLREQSGRLKPSFIFEIEYPQTRHKTQVFNDLCAENGSFYAFHGSAIENFHSILHHGLVYNLNKRSLFGLGTYLSSKLEVAILFSPFGPNPYKGSRLGHKLSCVAVCEVIDHPNVQAKKKHDTYYVVSNDELIRVAYLLIYSANSSTNNLHHLNVSSIPFGKPNKVETSATSNFVFLMILLMFVLIGFFMTKSPEI